jgi:hypothetical protein
LRFASVTRGCYEWRIAFCGGFVLSLGRGGVWDTLGTLEDDFRLFSFSCLMVLQMEWDEMGAYR